MSSADNDFNYWGHPMSAFHIINIVHDLQYILNKRNHFIKSVNNLSILKYSFSLLSNTFNLFGFPIFRFEHYMMMVIQEMRRAH